MKSGKTIIVIALIVVIGLWLASGIYTLKSDGGEKAVVTRFGEYDRTEEEPGLKWHLPTPIEKVETIQSAKIRTLEIGYGTSVAGNPNKVSQYVDRPNQSMMITKDENLIKTEVAIQYNIGDVKDYLFMVDSQEQTLIIAAESSIRRVVANHEMDAVLTLEKSLIQSEIKQDLQEICDSYNLGINIRQVNLQDVYVPQEVSEAFSDVLKAREDRTRYINEAEKYKNEIVNRAEGNAAEIVNKANAYKEKRIAEANGDVAKFVQILEQYKNAEDITRTRMYLETMEEVLPNVNIYIMDESSDVLKFLPLESGKDKGVE